MSLVSREQDSQMYRPYEKEFLDAQVLPSSSPDSQSLAPTRSFTMLP